MWTLAEGISGQSSADAAAVVFVATITALSVLLALVARAVGGRRRRDPRSRSDYS
jgi:hypothetical protein